MKRYSLVIAFIFSLSSVLAENSMQGFFKTRHKSVSPITEVYVQIIEQIDTDTCRNISKRVSVYDGGDIDRKALKSQLKKCKSHSFSFTRRQSSKRHTHLSSSFLMVINPEKQGEEMDILNVVSTVRLKDKECQHIYGFTKENGKWIINSKREIKN